MHHPVAYGFDFLEVFDDPVLGMHQVVQYPVDAHLVVGNRLGKLVLFAVRALVGEFAFRQADFFDQALGQDFPFRAHVDQLVFDRGAAAIKY